MRDVHAVRQQGLRARRRSRPRSTLARRAVSHRRGRVVGAGTRPRRAAHASIRSRRFPRSCCPTAAVLTESAAILIHLGLAHPDSGLLPADAARARAGAARPRVHRGQLLRGDRRHRLSGALVRRRRRAHEEAHPGRHARAAARSVGHVRRHVSRAAVPRRRAHLGALDLLAAVVSKWSGSRQHLATARPAFAALLARIEADPRVAPVFARHWPAARDRLAVDAPAQAKGPHARRDRATSPPGVPAAPHKALAFYARGVRRETFAASGAAASVGVHVRADVNDHAPPGGTRQRRPGRRRRVPRAIAHARRRARPRVARFTSPSRGQRSGGQPQAWGCPTDRRFSPRRAARASGDLARRRLRAGARRRVPSGYAALDAALPGRGWPQGALTELLLEREGIGEIRLTLPALARVQAAGRDVVWIAPPHRPYAPALAAAGLDLARLVIVLRARRRTRCGRSSRRCARPNAAPRSRGCPRTTSARCAGCRSPRAKAARGACCGGGPASAAAPPPRRCAWRSRAQDGYLAVRVLKRRGAELPQPVLIDVDRAPVIAVPPRDRRGPARRRASPSRDRHAMNTARLWIGASLATGTRVRRANGVRPNSDCNMYPNMLSV